MFKKLGVVRRCGLVYEDMEIVGVEGGGTMSSCGEMLESGGTIGEIDIGGRS